MEQDMLAGKLAEVDAQLAGVHAKLRSAAQMESAELDAAIAQTREETAQCAHALAERLQLPLFDKSILQKAAEDKGVSAEALARYDERPYSPLFCRSVRGISSAPEDCVAQMQFELLRQHANAGESFVVLGRCAEEVLADREGLVSIFVRADLDFRVKRTPLPEEEALDFIKHQDRQRRIYHDQHCKGDWAMPNATIW